MEDFFIGPSDGVRCMCGLAKKEKTVQYSLFFRNFEKLLCFQLFRTDRRC